jgi:predicted CXXCH cytochrome family protein
MRATFAILLAVALAIPGAARPQSAAVQQKFKLKPGAVGTTCLECHASFADVLKKPFVHTPVKSKDCTGCHNPHAAQHGKLLDASPTQTCLNCHTDIVPERAKSTHKPLAEKGCAICHDPHASAAKFNLVKPGNELCAGCHKPIIEQAQKAKFKHRPVDQGCSTCHNPHGSAKAEDLLKVDVPELCVKCHKTDGQIFAKQHMNYPVGKSRCTSCHDPHGSDKRGMLYNRVHAPVAKQMCNQCHEAPNSPKKFQPKVAGAELCRGCHAQKMTDMLDKSRVHVAVVEGDACLNCHNPHASKTPGLVKRGGMVTTCGACHPDTIRRQKLSPTKHDPVESGQCTACHDPHSSNGALMLINPDIIEGCGVCHDWLKHSSHPMGAKFVDPRNKNLTVQCLSCHRAHGTEYKHMMPYATTSDTCTKCHERFKR